VLGANDKIVIEAFDDPDIGMPQGKDDRAPVFIGCKEDVALAEEYIADMEE